MRKHRFIAGLLATILIFLILPLFTKIASVKAAYVFDDGITNWTKKTSSQVGQLPIGDNLNLGYAFGLAQDTSGKVSSGGDTTITQDSTANGINNINFSKMNVFLNDNGKYISSVFQIGFSNTTTAAEQVSLTSPNFMLVPSDSIKPITARDFAILGVEAASNGNIGLKNKEYYVGTDTNGNPAYKIVGDFSRESGSSHNGVYNLRAELLLRASPSNAAIVQRELYLYNPSTTTQSFTILFGEDTKLGESDGMADRVPIFDLGNKAGIYINNDNTTDSKYRLLVTNQLADGFTHYAGQEYSTGGTGNNWVSDFNPETISGNGAEAKNNPLGTNLLGASVDSSYALRWEPTTLEPGEVAHYGSTMGVTAKPYSVPSPKKTYTNLSSTDGKNHIGDKLKFSLQITNDGYGANWHYKQLTDVIPEGLQIDASSLKLIDNSGNTTTLDSTNYDATNRTLTVPTNKALTDNQSATVTFEANITSDAMQNLDSTGNLTNKADFTGLDNNVVNAQDKTFSASVKIPVEAPDFNFSFTKQVRNVTNNEADFQNDTSAKQGDLVEYKIVYAVASDSKDYLASGAQLTDDIPDGIQRVGNATITGPDGVTYPSANINTGIIDVKQGQSVVITFQAKVTQNSAGIITNLAKVTGGVTSANQNPGDMVSNGADVSVENVDAITSVPNLIDFGSINMYGQNATLSNISTDGELTISHPTSSTFSVNVYYDNDNTGTQMSNSNGETLPADDSGLIFIRQRDSNHSDTGNWTAISKSGTPIQMQNFSGNQNSVNLTNYVGGGDWQIKIGSGTKSGLYKGILTWGMVDSIN